MLQYFRVKKKDPSKTDDVIDKPGTLFFWNEKIR